MLLAPLVLLAACGGAGGGEPPAPSSSSAAESPPSIATAAPSAVPTTPVPVDPLVADPPPGGTALDAARVDTTGLPAGFPTLVWTRGPRTLGVYARAGGCTEGGAQLAGETAETVTVLVTQTTTSPGPCTRELRFPAIELTLGQDLGARRVVLSGVVR